MVSITPAAGHPDTNILSGGVVVTQTGMGSAQGIHAAWLTSRMEEHKRPVALAAYVMSIQLAGFPGSQLFRSEGMFLFLWLFAQANDATDSPRYRHGLIVAASCVISAIAVICAWKVLYWLMDQRNRIEGVAVHEGTVADVEQKV